MVDAVSDELEDLARELIEIQRQERWSDREMADAIGCRTSMWQKVRSGDRRPGRMVMDGAFRRWPRLQRVYARWLKKTK